MFVLSCETVIFCFDSDPWFELHTAIIQYTACYLLVTRTAIRCDKHLARKTHCSGKLNTHSPCPRPEGGFGICLRANAGGLDSETCQVRYKHPFCDSKVPCSLSICVCRTSHFGQRSPWAGGIGRQSFFWGLLRFWEVLIKNTVFSLWFSAPSILTFVPKSPSPKNGAPSVWVLPPFFCRCHHGLGLYKRKTGLKVGASESKLGSWQNSDRRTFELCRQAI